MTIGVETQRSLSCEPRLSLRKYHSDLPQRSGLDGIWIGGTAAVFVKLLILCIPAA
jgi:hypothetical protein